MEDWKKRRFKYLVFSAIFFATRSLIAKGKMKKYGIWHKPDEQPDFSKGAICVVYGCQDGFVTYRNICVDCNEKYWETLKTISWITKWAYREDFLDVVTEDYPL